MEQLKIDFRVDREPIIIKGKYLKYDALIHENGSLLAIVSKNYKLFTHRDALNKFIQILNILNIGFTEWRSMLIHNNKRFVYEVKTDVIIFNRFYITLVFENSLNTTTSFRIRFGLFDTVSEAGILIHHKGLTIGIAHEASKIKGITSKIQPSFKKLEIIYGTWVRTFSGHYGMTYLDKFLKSSMFPQKFKTNVVREMDKDGYLQVEFLKAIYTDRIKSWNIINEFTLYEFWQYLIRCSMTMDSNKKRILTDERISNLVGFKSVN